jgi:isopenicillin-N N-acyltransferase-like protein
MRRVPVCSSGNYVLCDAEGTLLDVELTPEGPRLLGDAGEGFIAHSNHFLCRPFACAENERQGLPDSPARLARLRRLIAAKFGSITVDDVQDMLRDHEGHPASICRHPHDGPDFAMLPSAGKTVAALIAEPQRGVFHVCRGNPCQNPFVEHRLDASPQAPRGSIAPCGGGSPR